MKFHIPLTIASVNTLKTRARPFERIFTVKRESKLREYLEKAEVDLTREEYLGIVARTATFAIVGSYLFFAFIFYNYQLHNALAIACMPAALIGIFGIFSQLSYPRVYANNQQRNIERNLINGMEDMLVQLTSGVPLFDILLNISGAEYGQLSIEFKKAVKKINAGFPQVEVIEELGRKNPSPLFRKALWQISNGMKAGSNITEVVRDILKSLNEEQYLQIQTYGNKLNPLIMFYMLVSIIMPALAITFLTIIASIANMPEPMTVAMFIGLFIFSVLIQIMFLGAIRTSKPGLL
jgi:pilus assembly protein TadC